AQAGGQDLLGGRAPLALDETAGELAGGVGLLAVIDGEGEEVAARDGRAFDGGHQHDTVAEAHRHGAVGLLGEFAGFEDQGAVAKGQFNMNGLLHVTGPLASGRSRGTEAGRTTGEGKYTPAPPRDRGP